jgi:hypothetical protein
VVSSTKGCSDLEIILEIMQLTECHSLSMNRTDLPQRGLVNRFPISTSVVSLMLVSVRSAIPPL